MGRKEHLSSEKKENIAIALKSGRTIRDVAKEFKCSRGAVENVLADYRVEIRKISEIQENKIREAITEFTPSDKTNAIEVHRKAMKSFKKNPGIALSAAEKTLDRIEGKPIQRNINENVNVEISSDKISKLLGDKGYMIVLDNI